MAKEKLVKLVSPEATARFPYLNTPDSYEGAVKYKVELVIPKDDPFIEELEAQTDAAYEAQVAILKAVKGEKAGKAKALLKVLEKHVPFEDQYDDAGDETGNVIVKTSSVAEGIKDGKPWKRKLNIFDSEGNHLKEPPFINGGATLKVEVELFPFCMAATKKAGISLRIGAVQIIQLSGGGSGGPSPFGKVEGGFVADEEPTFAEDSDESADAPDDEDDF